MKKSLTFISIVLVVCIIYALIYTNTISTYTSRYLAINLLFKKVSSDKWLIITSIIQLRQYLVSSQYNLSVVFIGNRPQSISSINNTNIIYLTPQLQSQLTFRSKNIKTIAYLLAIERGARFIYELNSNIPFHPYHHQHIQHFAFRRQRSLFINIYPTFTANFTLYSPGLPKDQLTNITQDGWSSIRSVDIDYETIHPLIQQQIPIFYHNKSSLVNHLPVAVEPFTFAPFSTDNILFTYDAFWGLILFESKSNIWRSWWVQRLLWDINGHVIFASSSHQTESTTASKNAHTVIEDANIVKFVEYLSKWKSSKTTLIERIKQLIDDTVEENFSDKTDSEVIRAWLDDLKQIKYVFPPIQPSISEQVTFLNGV